VTGEVSQAKSRNVHRSPTAVCFLFDMAFLWRSGYGKVPLRPSLFRPVHEKNA